MKYYLNKYRFSFENIWKISFILISLFPFFKRGYASVTIFLFLILSFFHYLKNKVKINGSNVLDFFIHSSVFLIYLFSLVYSSDLKESFKFLRISLPILIFPLIFFILVNFKISKNFSKYIIYSFLISVVFSLIVVNIKIGFYDFKNISQWEYRNLFEDITGVHGTYYSIWIGFSILVLINDLVSLKFSLKLISFFFLTYLIYWMLTLQARLPLFMTVILSINMIIQNFIRKRLRNMVYSILLILFIGFVINNSNKITEKLKFGEPKGKYELKHLEMTSEEIRTGIYICSYSIFLKNPFLGVGIGDVNKTLNSCYKSRLETDVYQKFLYNSHNQYVQILLSGGMLGFVFFIISTFFLVKNSIKSKNILYISFILFLSICFLTENILSRHDGVLFFSFFSIVFWKAHSECK